MNAIWSKYIQGVNTLYCNRRLRFDDMFKGQYQKSFGLDDGKPLKILEIGCGPGALAGALRRWYPNAEITAVDRDTEFIRFAQEHEKGITFLEADAVKLPFENDTFDVTISNTVAEHIEPNAFYGEQFRVLKTGGICLVLSARKGITVNPSCITPNDFENTFWEKAESYDNRIEKYEICKYPMSEAEIPAVMEKHRFHHVSTSYMALNLTPDNPSLSKELAHDMINSEREAALDSIKNIVNALPDCFAEDEIGKMLALADDKYNLRLKQYENGEKQWDTNVSLLMIIRGIK